MATKIGGKTPKTPKAPKAAPKSAPKKAPAAAKTEPKVTLEAPERPKSAAKVLGFTAGAVDTLAAPGLTMHSVRGLAGVGGVAPQVVADRILSAFPLHDLAEIKTEGRYAAGFRLDAGTVRLMWVSARRVADKDGKPAFDLMFTLHGKAVERYVARLKELGATSGKLDFFAADEDSTAPADKARLKLNGTTWAPSSSSGLRLEEAGKYALQIDNASQAIRGSVRIRLFGDDAEATQNLAEVVKKVGLQSVFAPPTPQSLEKFKLYRFLWQVEPKALDGLRYADLDDLDDELLDDDLEEAKLGPDAPNRKAIEAVELDDPNVAAFLRLMRLFYTEQPSGMLNWVKTQGTFASGFVPTASTVTQIKSALGNIGLAEGSDKVKAALASELSDESGRWLLRFGLLLKTAPNVAESLAARDVDKVKLKDIHAAMKSVGVDPTSERIQNLRFEEVYPGYFTVIDPQLAKDCEAAGARYLYSTSDNPERVHQMLTAGQKSSLTRFSEGLLVQGKSSDADFGSGGATSVFSRLVTETVIRKAAGSSGGTYGLNFHNWGGSRPYKLILNRALLGRLDWYAANGDTFGRTTNLTPESKGTRIIKTIDAAYSTTNEVMFPIGNDPAFVDYVVCENDTQKKALIDFLTAKGITSFNGKALADFIRVENKFFRLPQDVSLDSAMGDAVAAIDLQPAQSAIAERVKKLYEERGASPEVVEKLGQRMTDSLATALEGGVRGLNLWSVKTEIENHVRSATTAAAVDLSPVFPSIKDEVTATLAPVVESTVTNLASDYYVTSAISTAVQAPAREAAEAVAKASGLLAIPDLVLGVDKADLEKAANEVLDKLKAKVADAAKAAARAKIEEAAKEPGLAKLKSRVTESINGIYSYSYKSQSRQRAAQQALADLAALAPIVTEAKAKLLVAVKAQAETQLAANATSQLSSNARSYLTDELLKGHLTASHEELFGLAKEKLAATGKDKVVAAGKAFLEAAGQPVDEAALGERYAALLDERIRKDGASWVTQTPDYALVNKLLEERAKAVIATAAPDAKEAAMAKVVDELGAQYSASALDTMFTAEVDKAYTEVMAALAAEVSPERIEELYEKTLDGQIGALADQAWNGIPYTTWNGLKDEIKKALAPPPS